MTPHFDSAILVVFLIFCRVGGCLMLVPGFSSQRIPVRVRLYIAVGASMALTPPLIEMVTPYLLGATLITIGGLVISEIAVGLLIGSLARLFLLALETLATAIVMSIGLGNILGAPLNDDEPLPAMASFVTLAATTMIFVMDQHLEVIRGLFLSYTAVPIAATPGADMVLHEFVKLLQRSYLLALRISSPFLLLGLITNLAFGFLNRMVSQVPVYFVSVPFVITLGVYWFYVASRDFFTAFSSEFGAWLLSG